MQRAVCQGRFS